MRRIHLFEFSDLSWYPQVFRCIQTDYLQFVATHGSGQKNLFPLLLKAMQHAGMMEIVDLCSGGTGPWRGLQEQFKLAGLSVRIRLTDKYPYPDAIQKWADGSRLGIEYLSEPIDALNVPLCLQGMRTFFEAFHHFKPEQAKSILLDAVEKKVAIGIFEISLKPPFMGWFLLFSPLMTLISYLLLTPFMTPRTWQRFLWTYLIPIVPLVTCWDGIISFLRGYSLKDFETLTKPLRKNDYIWEMGIVPTGTFIFEYTYLLGYPTRP